MGGALSTAMCHAICCHVLLLGAHVRRKNRLFCLTVAIRAPVAVHWMSVLGLSRPFAEAGRKLLDSETAVEADGRCVQRLMAAQRQELAAMQADREDLLAVLDQLQGENKQLQNTSTVWSS